MSLTSTDWTLRAKAFLSAALICLALLSLSGKAEAKELIYSDKLNRLVSIGIPVKRAVLYESYELLPVTGAWDKVSGLSRHAFQNDLMLEARPDLASEIADAGSAMEASLEYLLSLKTDLVITWPNQRGDGQADFFAAKGLKVICVYPESLAELYDLMQLHGKIFEAQERIEAATAGMEETLAYIEARLSGLEREKTALFLFGQPNRVAGREGITQVLLDLIRVRNLAPEGPEKIFELGLERIYRLDPDIIFIWGSSPYGPERLSGDPMWGSLSAVRNGAVHKLPAWSSFSPRLAPLALRMAALAYPERFPQSDSLKAEESFFQKVYALPRPRP
jgi:iron complex transport system substrate-binding protein